MRLALAALRTAAEALDLRVLPLDTDDWEPLAQLRATTGLRMPACCVLHCALTLGARVATFDGQLVTAARSAGLTTLGG